MRAITGEYGRVVTAVLMTVPLIGILAWGKVWDFDGIKRMDVPEETKAVCAITERQQPVICVRRGKLEGYQNCNLLQALDISGQNAEGESLPVQLLSLKDENGKELLKREESGIDCGEMMLSPGYYDLTMRAEEKYEGVVYKTELMYRFTVD